MALVSSGDAGIYGMAGLVLEMCAAQGLKVGPPEGGAGGGPLPGGDPRRPGPGRGAALLGAPLMHDFVAISLSDLLTPWEIIEAPGHWRPRGDFVIVLYNPKSKKRDWQLGAVRDMLLRHKDPDTPVGIVSRAMREGQATTITTLQDLPEHPVDMQTIVIVGNSQTYTYGDYMITPRGYWTSTRWPGSDAASFWQGRTRSAPGNYWTR